MDKMGYPRGLIRYSSENALERHLDLGQIARRVVRPRILIYTAVLWIIIIVAAFALTNRVPVKVDVIRDRMTMAAADDPLVENVYRLQVMNTSETARQFRITASGITGIELESQKQPISIDGASQRVIPVRLRVEKQHTRPGANRIVFTVQSVGDDEPILIEEGATLVAPKGD